MTSRRHTLRVIASAFHRNGISSAPFAERALTNPARTGYAGVGFCLAAHHRTHHYDAYRGTEARI